jgi:hypothetical protein
MKTNTWIGLSKRNLKPFESYRMPFDFEILLPLG